LPPVPLIYCPRRLLCHYQALGVYWASSERPAVPGSVRLKGASRVDAAGQRYRVARSDYERAYRLLLEKWLSSRLIIEDRLRGVLSRLGDDALPDVARFIVEGGKRFRGFLTIIMAEALGGRPEDAADAAAAIELVQAASLAIDDIIDRDTERRGKASAWRRFGISRTILVSLILIPVAQRIVEKLGFTALFHVIRSWEATVRGEVADSILASRLGPDKYLRVIELKTAALFKLATLLGAMSAGVRDRALLNRVGEYGRLLGIVYQIADDIADYTRSDRHGPGEELFAKWARTLDPQNPLEAAKNYLRTQLQLAAETARSIPSRDSGIAKLLEILPAFLVEKLFEEASLDPGHIFQVTD